jgi:hypothetical protein
MDDGNALGGRASRFEVGNEILSVRLLLQTSKDHFRSLHISRQSVSDIAPHVLHELDTYLCD